MLREAKGAPDISAKLAASTKTAITEEVDCFSPHRTIEIEYSGPNIDKIIKSAPKWISRGLRVSSTNVFLDDYFWTNTDPNNITFHIFFRGKLPMDSKSAIFAQIRLRDGLIKPDGSGKVIIEFSAVLETKFERKSVIQRSGLYRSLLWTYNQIWYNERRRKFLDECKSHMDYMMLETKSLLKLMKTA